MAKIIKKIGLGIVGLGTLTNILAQNTTAIIKPDVNFGIETRFLETELPIKGFYDKVFFNPGFKYEKGKIKINAGLASEFAQNDLYPSGTENTFRFFVNRLGLNYSPEKDLEIVVGTFAEKFFGWNEPIFPRNGTYAKFSPKIKGLDKFVLESEVHLGQYMIPYAETPYYGISAKAVKNIGSNKLIAGLNFKDFEGGDYFVVNSLVKYSTHLKGHPLDITVLGMVNLNANEGKYGYVIKADYHIGKTTITFFHPFIGKNATPKEYAPQYTPQVGFTGGGLSVGYKITEKIKAILGMYNVFPDGKPDIKKVELKIVGGL